ncbi:hypothetical protein LTR82_017887 [Friedmanniomyces endolithicus]|uniref:Uncharacterized protein n=1 Tax=Friedmanniomyces endolithicus TaxID=329885 RepID=A0AAN6F5M5_9PEZI|nr:hypothetical protein LTR82_017887 [Friedmanniomyces endolithicus]
MPKNPPDERLVYLALRHEFLTGDAPSKLKKIKERVLRQGKSSEMKALIQEHNIDSICQVAKGLLDDRIYHSTIQAKIRFPEVFEVSPAQSAERNASEAEAARCEADALKDVERGGLEQMDVICTSLQAQQEVGKLATKPSSRHAADENRPIPSLYPVYLPLRTQHKLLTEVQTILEGACYDFGQKRMQETLQEKGWDCPESVELNIWPNELRRHKQKLVPEDLEGIGKSFDDLLDSSCHLRHTAVHRLRVTAARVEQFMSDAEVLCRLMQDEQSAETVARMRRKMQACVEEIKRNKDLLESRLKAIRKDFLWQKAVLESREQAAIAQVFSEDQECQQAVGSDLECSVKMTRLDMVVCEPCVRNATAELAPHSCGPILKDIENTEQFRHEEEKSNGENMLIANSSRPRSQSSAPSCML